MSEPTFVSIPLIHEPMRLYEQFRHEAESMALLAVQRAPTTEAAEDAYNPVWALCMMVQLLSGENLDAEGVVALIRKLQDDVAEVQGTMFRALMARRERERTQEDADE